MTPSKSPHWGSSNYDSHDITEAACRQSPPEPTPGSALRCRGPGCQAPASCEGRAVTVRIRPLTEHGQYHRRLSERCPGRPWRGRLVELDLLELARLVAAPGPGHPGVFRGAGRTVPAGAGLPPADGSPQRGGDPPDARAEEQPGAPGRAAPGRVRTGADALPFCRDRLRSAPPG